MITAQDSHGQFAIQVVTFRYDIKRERLAVSSIKNYGKFETKREAHDLLRKHGWWSKGEPVIEDKEDTEEYDFRQSDGGMLYAKIINYTDIGDISELFNKTR